MTRDESIGRNVLESSLYKVPIHQAFHSHPITSIIRTTYPYCHLIPRYKSVCTVRSDAGIFHQYAWLPTSSYAVCRQHGFGWDIWTIL